MNIYMIRIKRKKFTWGGIPGSGVRERKGDGEGSCSVGIRGSERSWGTSLRIVALGWGGGVKRMQCLSTISQAS